jgi:hypothetical protein
MLFVHSVYCLNNFFLRPIRRALAFFPGQIGRYAKPYPNRQKSRRLAHTNMGVFLEMSGKDPTVLCIKSSSPQQSIPLAVWLIALRSRPERPRFPSKGQAEIRDRSLRSGGGQKYKLKAATLGNFGARRNFLN